ncbi:MAG: hypothetical protein SVM80_13580, partial [Halobacteriota archaeon]|nr:hypothetical protein [Halobacteriota archaeon]
GALCYVLGWLTGILFLVLEMDSRFVQFHAMQSIVTFLSLSVIFLLIGWIPIIGGVNRLIIGIISAILWLFLILKAYDGEFYKLPIAGDLAEVFLNQ